MAILAISLLLRPWMSKAPPIASDASKAKTAQALTPPHTAPLQSPNVHPQEELPALSETQVLKAASATNAVARSLLQKQDEEDKKQLEALLGPVVEFMQAIAKPYSALAFLRDESGTLRLNAHVSRSQHLRPDAVIREDEGLLGGLLYRTSPFITGDVTAFRRQPEYYDEGEHILAMIALPVFLGDSHKEGDLPEAMLVMDSMQRFRDDITSAMRSFAQVSSALITAERSRALLSRQQIVRQVLYNVQERLAKHLKSDQILPILIEELSNIFEYRRLVFCTWNPTLKRGSIAHVAGEHNGMEPGTTFDFSQGGAYGRIFRQQKPELIPAVRDHGSILYDKETDAKQSWLPLDVLAVPLVNDEHRTVAVLGIETDQNGSYQSDDLQLLSAIAGITSIALQKARMYAEMEKLATMDGLTGIPNHRHFQGLLSQQIEMVNRYGGTLGFLLFDIDHFKDFNDTYGHAIGDLVLREVARCVSRSSRTTDIVARYGGEEFVVVLPKSDLETSMQSAERVRAAIEAMAIPHEGQEQPLKVTVSIGVSTYPEQASTKQQLIDNSDKAMYLSKRTGRNRVSVYGPEAEALAVEKEK